MSEHEDYLAAEHKRLQRAAYSRDASPEALADLAAFEQRLAAERAAAAVVEPPAATSVEFDSLIVDEDIPDVAEPRVRRRPWLPIALGLAVVLVVGAVVAVRPMFTAPAQKSAPASSPKPTSTTPISVSPTLSSPAVDVASYSGSATCYNLVDVNTIEDFAIKGYENVSDSYVLSQAKDTTSPVYPFIAAGGLVCAWGRHTESVYAYAPISASAGRAQEAALQMKANTGTVGTYRTYSITSGTYVFGRGWWAYASDEETASIIDQLIAHVPENEGKKRTDLQSDVYVTSEGVGDLRIDSPVPSGSRVAAWNPNACSSGVGAYRASEQFTSDQSWNIQLVTENRERRGKLTSILIRTPLIPTKSGIRVGDAVEKVEKAFPGIEKKQFELTGTVGKIRFTIGAFDPDHPEDVVVVAISVVPVGDDFPSEGTDANGPCPA